MKAHHVKRLHKLADFLDTVPKKNFDFERVVYDRGDGPPRKDFSCGTTACAMGYTPLLFPKLVEWAVVGEFNDSVCGVIPKGGNPCTHSWGGAAMELFGIEGLEVDALFWPDANRIRADIGLSELPKDPTPKQVARNIRKFIKLKSK